MTATLIEIVRLIDTESLGIREVHPAWRAIVDLHPRMCGVQAWAPGNTRMPGFVWDWEIALSMIVRGYGSDITRAPGGWRAGATPPEAWNYPFEGGCWYRYILPPVEVSVCEDFDVLPLNPDIDLQLITDYYERQFADGKVQRAEVTP